MEKIIEKIMELQTYKLFSDTDELLVDREAVISLVEKEIKELYEDKMTELEKRMDILENSCPFDCKVCMITKPDLYTKCTEAAKEEAIAKQEKQASFATEQVNETEFKTIQEWAKLEGIQIVDPDGFDRKDPLLWERKFSKEEYIEGMIRSSIIPLDDLDENEEDE